MPLAARHPCFTATLARLRSTESGSSLTANDIRQLTNEARSLCTRIVEVYDQEVASGEVGRGGTGRASSVSGGSPTGLLYGRVQSGKTNAMVMTAAAAFDNGFKVVLVLTSDSTDLVDQTFDRFGCVLGPSRYSSSDPRLWRTEAARMAAQIDTAGLLFICAKNGHHLAALLRTLRAVRAQNYPALILDDEGDQATPDTTVAARSRNRINAPTRSSTVHRRTMHNDDPRELGDSLREYLRHNLLLQVTATPNALFLQNITSPLRPSFVRLLPPGRGYCGGEDFFRRDLVPTPPNEPSPPLVYISESENLELRTGSPAPSGLRSAALFFLVAATAHKLLGGDILGGMKCLVHTSTLTDNHEIVATVLRHLMAELQRDRAAARPLLQTAYNDLLRSLPNAPRFSSILRHLWQQLPGHGVHVVNANGSYGRGHYPDLYNFVVGGNVLGRGLTIRNLIVTYYSRRAVAASPEYSKGQLTFRPKAIFTAGDLQRDSAYYVTYALDERDNRYVLNYGNVANTSDFQRVVEDASYSFEGGTYPCEWGWLDCGYNAEEVFDLYLTSRGLISACRGVKGENGSPDINHCTVTYKSTKVPRYDLKDSFYKFRLIRTIIQQKRINLFLPKDTDHDFKRQLVNEKIITFKKNGKNVERFKDGARNHYFDCVIAHG